MLKLIAVIKSHTACVKAICITDEYPLMTTCSLDGMICVFSIRGGFDRQQTSFLAKFVNIVKIENVKILAAGVTCAQSIVLNSNVVFETELAGKIKKLPLERVEYYYQDEIKM